MMSDLFTLLAVTLAKQYTYTACNGLPFDSTKLLLLLIMLAVSRDTST